jgi:hypothetical protein
VFCTAPATLKPSFRTIRFDLGCGHDRGSRFAEGTAIVFLDLRDLLDLDARYDRRLLSQVSLGL